MKHYFTILSHELRMLLVSASTYITAVLFLALMGYLFVILIEMYTKSAQDTPPAAVYFQLFWLPVWFMVPLLTMRCLSEERRLGTLETLLTAPVTTAEVVLAKFSAAYLLYLALWLSTGGFFLILHRFADDAQFLDSGPLLGGFVFIAVSGLMFVAIGVFASSLSGNQAVAAIISFVLIGLFVFGPWLALNKIAFLNLESMQGTRAALDYLQVFHHLDDFTRGILDTREMLIYLSGTTLALIFSVFSVEAKLLHS